MSKLELLLTQNFDISSDDLNKALRFQSRHGGRLEQILINMGALAEESLVPLFQKYLDLQGIESSKLEQSQGLSSLGGIPQSQWLSRHWLPVEVEGGHVLLCRDPLDPTANEMMFSLSEPVELAVVTEAEFNQVLAQCQQNDLEHTHDHDDLSSVEEERLRELASEAPVVNLLNGLIARGLKLGASDMHLEPFQGQYRVRMRTDGVLHEIERIAPRFCVPLVSRLKILSGMDIAEKRRPQDGKIAMKIANEELDIRVSALPLNEGESVVLRFLRQQAIRYDMATLGLAPDLEANILADIKKTAGVVLLTGPTGSGKTTSLYTFLSQLDSNATKIITLEDPVEYQLPGINQVQVQTEIGFGFAEGLRSIVRQDPDVIMLGEIRDAETARIAMQSALTGHLVFSTVHTNDAPSAYTRLMDLGAEEFLLNAALVSIVAQRLVRRLCDCAITMPPEQAQEQIARYGIDKIAQGNGISPTLKQTCGCEYCGGSGYKGRMAILEYLPIDDTVRGMPKDENFIHKVTEYRRSQGGRDLVADGLLKVAQGLTTVDEVMRVAG